MVGKGEGNFLLWILQKQEQTVIGDKQSLICEEKSAYTNEEKDGQTMGLILDGNSEIDKQ